MWCDIYIYTFNELQLLPVSSTVMLPLPQTIVTTVLFHPYFTFQLFLTVFTVCFVRSVFNHFNNHLSVIDNC